MAEPQDEVVRSLTELLSIARIAMPDFVFATDPRVHRARQLILTRLQRSPGCLTPIAGIPAEQAAVLPEAGISEARQMPGAAPPPDITTGLDAYMASGLAPATRTEAIVAIIRDWLVGYGYLRPAPDTEN